MHYVPQSSYKLHKFLRTYPPRVMSGLGLLYSAFSCILHRMYDISRCRKTAAPSFTKIVPQTLHTSI